MSQEKLDMQDANPLDCEYSFFSHTKCEFFPCHATSEPENFNCLFCYCPLYALGERCQGAFSYTDAGVKDCSACAFPHKRENYALVLSRFQELAALIKRDK